MRAARKFVIAAVYVLATVSAVAQVAIDMPSFGSYAGGPDMINLGNLNVHWTFPIGTKAGRGLPFSYPISYDSSIWAPITSNGVTSWVPPASSSFGWPTLAANNAGLPGSISYAISLQTLYNIPCNPPGLTSIVTVTWYINWTYTDGTGNSHIFPGRTSSVYPPCPYLNLDQSTLSGPSSDGYELSITNYTVASIETNAGTNVTPGYGATCGSGVWSEVDSNGNTINESCGVYTDTLGQTALTITGANTAPPVVFTQNNATGTSTYTLKYTSQTVQTNFQCPGIIEYPATTQQLPSELDYPDGSKYTFVYEPTPGYSGSVTGRIQAVHLPYGGTITYYYSGGGTGVNGINCGDGSAVNIAYYGPDGNTNYSRTGISAASATTTIAYPSYQGVQNHTVINFTSSGYGQNYYEVSRQIYSGPATGTPLETILTCYDASFGSCATSASGAIASNGTFIWQNVYRTVQIPDSTGISSGTADTYSNGINTQHIDYDFGSAGSGLPSSTKLRTVTTTTNAFGSPSIYMPTEVQVSDSGGVLISDTKYNYGTSVITTTGTPQLASVPSGNRINLTSVQRLSSGSNWLTSSASYYDTGNVATSTDLNGAQTTFTYGSGISCGNSFPTSVSSQTGGSVVTSLTTSATWNCVGGVKLTDVDANGNTTTYSYGSDPFWRPVSVTNNATGQVTTYGYSGSGSHFSSSSMTFNGGASIANTVTFYDPLNRPILNQTRQAPGSSSYDTVATTYDSLGRVASKTLPYSGTINSKVLTNPGTVITYDPLNRPIQATQVTKVDGTGSSLGYAAYTYSKNDVFVQIGPQVTVPSAENFKRRNLEYNGAGWLTSVCELTSLTGNGACGQANSYSGYLTKYTYDGGRLTTVQQNSQPGSSGVQTRSVSYDLLGRKTSETIPEWSNGSGTAGTSTYTYDLVSGTCNSTSTGDLVETQDNIGNVTCYTYDLLHRMLSSTVVAGSYAAQTPLAYYVYDAATLSGTAMQNAKGALAEAYTCSTSACSSKLTDVFMSATPVTSGSMAGGVQSQMWEATPNSSGYFLTTDTYFPNGVVGAISASRSGASIGIPNITYGVDGEGRPNTASDGTHSLVTATAYNPASAPTSVTFGNAATGLANDVDSFGYDPSTYLPNSLISSVSPSSGTFNVTTALTWNQNGSLQKLVYTDGSPSPQNQTCNYSADDLSRIAVVDCGSGAWGQNFSYDPFGNITKGAISGRTGTTYSASGYSAATNQVTGGISPVPTYDKNGNQLMSTPATLAWNAWNVPISVNGTPVTYDALGRMVEKGSSSPYTQFVYRPSGNTLAVYSPVSTKGTIPLPGGNTAIYSGSGLNYIRHTDWLGSSRLATTWTHTVYSKEAYAPFGEAYNEAGTQDRSFTAQDQDLQMWSSGSGVYDFLFRKHDPSAGRWLSTDPAGWAAADLTNPQSFNQYAYVTNNPTNLVDPLGLDHVTVVDGCVYVVAAFYMGWDPSAGVSTIINSQSLIGCNPNASVADPNCPPGSVCVSLPGGGGGAPSNTGHVVGCLARGALVGAGGSLLAAGAVGLASLAGPEAGAAVAGGLFVAGVVGGATTLYSAWTNASNGNYAGAAYDLGSLAGGVGAGSVVGGAVGDSINPPATRGWSFGRDFANRWKPSLGWNPLPWLKTGPDAAAGAGATGGAGAGLAHFLRGSC